MPRELRLAYFAHSLRSDWNNGNAHFLRGLMRGLRDSGHIVTVYERESDWSIENLHTEPRGTHALQQFHGVYPDLNVQTYGAEDEEDQWYERLRGIDVVLLHEWHPPHMAELLLRLRARLGFKLLFHDTHHRASSSPEQMQRFGLTQFDGIVAFGAALRTLYREKFALRNVWVLHEAADTSVFHPLPEIARLDQIVWIGNWGDEERTREYREFLLGPACALGGLASTVVYGVRYPQEGTSALARSGIHYGGYLPNLDAPALYAAAQATLHIPRRHYASAMHGIPTIRVFEALACGIPLVSAPWDDAEGLFREGDFTWARNGAEMTAALRALLTDREAARDQAARGLDTVLARHTCLHRARELTAICEEVLQ